MTWIWLDDGVPTVHEEEVRVELRPAADGTLVTLTHALSPAARAMTCARAGTTCSSASPGRSARRPGGLRR